MPVQYTSRRPAQFPMAAPRRPASRAVRSLQNCDLVIVPAWRRPDFLRATLTRLAIADDEMVRYWLVLDRNHSSQVDQVAHEFEQQLGWRVEVKTRRHRYRGNSYNVLTSYAEASRVAGVALVHLVEEDVFVAGDYFDLHRRAHALCPGAFAVSACRNQNQLGDPPADEEGLYTDGRYQSLGVSFRLAVLRELVAPHATPKYFDNPTRYCSRVFPHSAIAAGHTEQDGLLDRIVEASGLRVAFPMVPRAYHAGFHGYNRLGAKLGMPVQEAAQLLLAMDSEQLNSRAHSYPDHHTTPLDQQRQPVSRVDTWPQ